MGKIREYDKEGVFIRKKIVFIFLKAFFKKMGDAKYAAGSQPSCDNASGEWIEQLIR